MGYAARLMCTEDIPEVTEIDREAFPTDWYPTSFFRELNSKMTRHLVACEESKEASGSYSQIGTAGKETNGKLWWLVSRVKRLIGKGRTLNNGKAIQTNQNIVGYATFWLMAGEAHLTAIAVREVYRRRGIGELLLISAINLAAELNTDVFTLEVRSSNLSAQTLYEKYGFDKVGVRRGYYSDDSEDAVIMTTERIKSVSYQSRFKQLQQAYTQRWGTNYLSYPLDRLEA
jgi:ribosomal-protein-alanine N-acetyltransferase